MVGGEKFKGYSIQSIKKSSVQPLFRFKRDLAPQSPFSESQGFDVFGQLSKNMLMAGLKLMSKEAYSLIKS